MQKKSQEIKLGTIRIKASNLGVYEKTKTSWKRSSRLFPEAMLVINLFKRNGRFACLTDRKNPEFLKGQLSADNIPQGTRINILSNGKKLNKAFSLFAPHLMIHDEKSKSHWDVIYQNKGGTYSYLYTLDKIQRSTKKKYKVVKEFEKCYPRLKSRVYHALKDENDLLAVPMYTLLKTYMRVGNEIYYKLHRHKGLTTMKKKDIDINGTKVSFHYIGKDGVPTSITERFPKIYIERLRKILEATDNTSFVFANSCCRHPISEEQFLAAFERYCGRKFYPHIVRSYYATKRVKELLKNGKPLTKEKVNKLFYSLAEKLGHKRFIKKEHVWREDYTVTIHHYVQPEILEKVKALIV